MVSEGRKESNRWLKKYCKNIKGKVLSIGSGEDSDDEGDFYKNYFSDANEYLTSEVGK